MLLRIGALEEALFNRNTILLEISEEINKNKYVYSGGYIIYSFITNDTIYKYFSIMGNNLIPYSIAISEENIYFLSPHYKYT